MHIHRFILKIFYFPRSFADPIDNKFDVRADFRDVIICTKFNSNPFRGFDLVGGVEIWTVILSLSESLVNYCWQHAMQ